MSYKYVMKLIESTKHMQAARVAKDDEFYTKYADVEKEMKHWNFSGKVIYCCCDNPEWSQVYKYFESNYKALGLKGLISSHFEQSKSTYWTEFYGDERIQHPLKGNGDCTSAECKELADMADMIVTNPPFSIFPNIVKTYQNKPFLMLCTEIKMVVNNTIWNMYLHGKIRYGYTGINSFYRPNGEADKRVGCLWYTNLTVHKNYPELNFVELDDTFDLYDNYDAIEGAIKKIPITEEKIGLPVTVIKFIDPDNPPFKILGRRDDLRLNGKKMYSRVIVQI